MPVVELELVERAAELDAGVVDQYVDAAEPCDPLGDRILVGDVERGCDRAVPEHGLAGLRRPAVDRHPGTRVCERARHREPEPARRARHERGQAGEVERPAHPVTGSSTCEGWAAVWRTVWCATCMRVPVPTSSPVLRFREKRGKLELVTSRRTRWPRRKTLATG